MDTSINFNEKKGFICDMDGVIYHGNRILPGVAEFIQWLHEENKEYLFLTNNSGYTPRELNQKLARMGLDVPEEHFYTSALATAAFLREQAPGCSVFAIGEAGLLNADKSDSQDICFVPDGDYVSFLRGQGVADRLVRAALEQIQANGGTAAATCSYAAAWLDKHPQ